MSRIFLAALAAASLSLGCENDSGIELLDGTGTEATGKIYNGSAPSAAEHDAVVALHQTARNGRSVYVSPFCSGTLIRGDVVVTAAHCVAGLSAKKVVVFVGDEASGNSSDDNYLLDHVYTVTEVWSHPSYSSSQLTDDIALLRLSSDAAAAEGVSPVAELPASEGFTSADVGVTNLNFAGFGVTESGSFGVKLQVDLVLGGLGCSVRGCPSGGDTATQISYSQPLIDGGPCSGDSGGPAFITRTSGTYVAGLTSYGDANCRIYGVSTRTDSYESEILAFSGDAPVDTGPVDTGPVDTGPVDTGPVDTGPVDTGSGGTCGDGVCGTGESCDGQSGTTECSDCDGKTNGKPSGRYCYVEGSCTGDGCP
jgi:secreted trypsin-like serine protease